MGTVADTSLLDELVERRKQIEADNAALRRDMDSVCSYTRHVLARNEEIRRDAERMLERLQALRATMNM